jgi:hypothetical protein
MTQVERFFGVPIRHDTDRPGSSGTGKRLGGGARFARGDGSPLTAVLAVESSVTMPHAASPGTRTVLNRVRIIFEFVIWAGSCRALAVAQQGYQTCRPSERTYTPLELGH